MLYLFWGGWVGCVHGTQVEVRVQCSWVESLLHSAGSGYPGQKTRLGSEHLCLPSPLTEFNPHVPPQFFILGRKLQQVENLFSECFQRCKTKFGYKLMAATDFIPTSCPHSREAEGPRMQTCSWEESEQQQGFQKETVSLCKAQEGWISQTTPVAMPAAKQADWIKAFCVGFHVVLFGVWTEEGVHTL